MGNILNVTRKEIIDVLNSKLFLIMLIFFLFIFIFSFYSNVDFRTGMSSMSMVLPLYLNFTCYYGTLVAMALGFSAFFSEMDGKAINTLLTKPLYRDSILNGKFISAIILSVCLFIFTTVLFILAIMIYFIDPIEPVMFIFIILPSLLILSILCNLFFYSLTLLICVTIRDQILSLFMTFLSWIIIFWVIQSDWFSGYMSYYFHSPELGYFISSFSPVTLVNSVLSRQDFIGEMITGSNLDLIKLVLYTGIIVFITYTAFIRRDVA